MAIDMPAPLAALTAADIERLDLPMVAPPAATPPRAYGIWNVPDFVPSQGLRRMGSLRITWAESDTAWRLTACQRLLLAGADLPTGCRGISWEAPLRTGREPDREAVFAECDSSRARMVRSDRWKYTCALDDPVEQLFDLDADPGETVNLAAEARCAAVLQRHRYLLDQWEAGHDLAPGIGRFTRTCTKQE